VKSFCKRESHGLTVSEYSNLRNKEQKFSLFYFNNVDDVRASQHRVAGATIYIDFFYVGKETLNAKEI
jgi:hypothetical protein